MRLFVLRLAQSLGYGSPNLHYQWHGQIWSRYPVPKTIKTIPKGAVLHQKNAYVTIPFTLKDDTLKIENLRQELLNPLSSAGSVLSNGIIAKESPRPLARVSEAQDSPINKALIWEALGLVKDPQLYKADISIVDLGLVYDVAVRGSVVTVTLAMPHRGRPLGAYFTHSSNVVHATVSKTMMEAVYAVPGVRKVIMEQTWYPLWNVNLLTDAGRLKLQL
jgi:metal-sulfur cluster biosynthetic enzyme